MKVLVDNMLCLSLAFRFLQPEIFHMREENLNTLCKSFADLK